MTIPDLSQYMTPEPEEQAGPVIPDLSKYVTPPTISDVIGRVRESSERAIQRPDVSLVRPEEQVDHFDQLMTSIEQFRREHIERGTVRGQGATQQDIEFGEDSQEPLPPTQIQIAEGIGIRPETPAISSRGVTRFERLLGRTGAQIAGGVDMAKHAASNPIETLEGIITAPFVISYSAFKEVATQSGLVAETMSALVRLGIEDPEELLGAGASVSDATPEAVRDHLVSIYGEMTPMEAKEARRAFSALMLSFAAAPVGGAGGLRLAQAGGLGLTGSALLAGQAGAISAGVTLGFVEASPEDRLKMTIGYGLIAAPFGLAHASFGRVLAEINNIRSGNPATDAGVAGARIRMSRAFDEVPNAINLEREGIGRRPDVTGEGIITIDPKLLEQRFTSIREQADPLIREILQEKQGPFSRTIPPEKQKIVEAEKQVARKKFGPSSRNPDPLMFQAEIDRIIRTHGERRTESRPVEVERRGTVEREFKRVIEEGEGRRDVSEAELLQAEKGVVPPVKEVSKPDIQLQQSIDIFEDQLAAKYGEKSVIKFNPYGESDVPFTAQEAARLRELYLERDRALTTANIQEELEGLGLLSDESFSGPLGETDVQFIVEEIATLTRMSERSLGRPANPGQVADAVLNRAFTLASDKGLIPPGTRFDPQNATQAQQRIAAGLTNQVSNILKDVGVPQAETIAPANRQIASAKTTQNLINSDLNTTLAIIKTHKNLKPDGVTVVPGVQNPAEAIRIAQKLMPDNHIVVPHRRPDGLFDVALGGRKSALKGSQSQFSRDGFYEGQAVTVDGTFYHYKSRQGDKVILRVPGSDRNVKLDFNRLRRAPYVNEVKVAEGSVEQTLSEIKEVLVDEPGTYDAIAKMHNKLKPDVTSGNEMPKPDIDYIAASNNMRVERASPGTFKVLDQETGHTLIRGLRTKAEAEKFINDNMQTMGDEAIGPNNGPPDIPINTINDITGPPAGGDIAGPSGGYGVPFTAAPKWRLVDNWRVALDERIRWMTSRRDNFDAMDARFPGLQSSPEAWAPLQEAVNRTNAVKNPILDRYKKQFEPLVKDLIKSNNIERLESLLDAVEAFSPDELRSFLKPEEVTFSERLSALDVDLARIYAFRRELTGLLDQFAKQEKIKVSEIPAKIRIGLRDALIEQSKLSRNEIAADRIFSEVVSRDMSEVDLYNVTRMHDAIVDNSLSRSELSNFHKFTSKERRAVQVAEDLYKAVADAIELPDWRRLPGYVSHTRKYGAVDPKNAFEQRAPTGSKFEQAQNIAAEMIRSGEITDYVRDLPNNLLHYINSTINSKFFVTEWNRVSNVFKDRINELTTDKFGNPVTEADRARIRQNIDDYLNDVRGFRNEAEKALGDYIEETAKELGVKTNPKQRTDFVNMYLAVNSSAALGWRVGMGYRDFGDYTVRFGSRFGYNNAFEYMARVNPVTESGRAIIEALDAQGKFNQLHHLEFARPGELEAMGLGGRAQKVASKVAEAGLRGSLQPQLHKAVQASTYIFMRDKVTPFVNKLIESGEHTSNLPQPGQPKNAKYKAYAKGKIFTFTDSPIQHFDNLVKAGKTEQAVDYIARQAAHEIAYDYGSGNGPYGSRRPLHRMGLQYGTWSMNTRSSTMRGISRGTLADRYGYAARFALGQAAIYATGLTTGLNMSRFYLIPGIFFSGGPFLQYAQFATNIMSGSQWDQERSAWAFTRLLPRFGEGDMRSLFLPGSYAMYDYLEAARLFSEGRDVYETSGRALGIPIQTEHPMWWDMYIPGAPAIREALENR